jgi:hypothetical protein
MTPGAAVGGGAGVVAGTGEGGGSSSACCAVFCGAGAGDEPEQPGRARNIVAISGRMDKNLLRNAATLRRSIGNGNLPKATDALAIGNRLEAGPVCYCETKGSTMGFTSKPVRVIEIPEPASEPLLAPESEPQRTEREEEVPVTTPA